MIFEKKQLMRDLRAGQPVADVFVLAEAKQGQARNGPFWSLTLQDASGRMEARIWSPQSQAYAGLEGGCLAYIEGQTQSYREQLQLNVDRLETLALEDAGLQDEALDLSMLVPCSAEPPADILERVEEIIRQQVHYPPWRRFVASVLGNEDVRRRLLLAVGGKAIHHAYVGGLLEHTLGVMRLCLSFCDLYPRLDREILLAAAVFHDLGKAWELGGGLVADYTDAGRLLGHIHLGLEILEPYLQKAKLDPELVMHFKHLILSHHGEYQYGSPKRPKTAEAMALHYADNLDAKMNQFFNVFAQSDGTEQSAEEQIWSPYQRSLERFIFLPKATPGKQGSLKRNDKRDDQCLLPLKA